MDSCSKPNEQLIVKVISNNKELIDHFAIVPEQIEYIFKYRKRNSYSKEPTIVYEYYFDGNTALYKFFYELYSYNYNLFRDYFSH